MRRVIFFIAGLIGLSVGCSNGTAPGPGSSNQSPILPQVLQTGGPLTKFTRFSPSTFTGKYGGIVTGPDSNMYFLDTNGPGLVKITMSGTTTEYPLPSQYPYELQPVAIAPAPGGKFYVLACNPYN